ncbi:MAG: NAD(P)/FAD-dependent oxidoreductase [Bacteroidetes bacterium]|nr:NAD(P)/FAD-dependent oxidoreductase [Bacteroidota bacterium]
MITTDICIVGAGPVGLFAIFECGLLKMRCHLIDYLPQVGGQLSEIYPKKPIYDIPGYPSILAQELSDKLMEQAAPFKPTFTLGERVESFEKTDDGFTVLTSDGTEVHAKVIVIAGGLGCFEPRKPNLDRLEEFEKKGVEYIVKEPEHFKDKKVVIAGGGDSALDWAMYLSDLASELTLVHRGASFRGAPDSAQKILDLAAAGKINLKLEANVTGLSGNGVVEGVTITENSGAVAEVATDYFLPLFGLSPKLGPIAEWGLNLDKNAIEVNTDDYSTNIPGVYAIGDINTYTNKLKLILCGFHEAALMAHSAAHIVFPDKKISVKYTTINGIQEF